jgi:hypothetical protein
MAPKDKNFPMAGKLGGMGGKYGRKAENLTAKELKKAGGAKASAARTVSISDTRRDTTRGITLGPKGKPLTGKVVLANGNTAVYKAGKRVVAGGAAKKTTPAVNRPAAKTPAEIRAAAVRAGKADAAKRGAAGVSRTPSAARKAGAAADAKARMNRPRTEASIRSRNDSIRDAPLDPSKINLSGIGKWWTDINTPRKKK